VRDALGLVSAFGYRSGMPWSPRFRSSVARGARWSARCVSIRRADERAVAGPPRCLQTDTPQAPKPDDPVHRELAALPPAQALSMVLLDTRGQRRHAPRAASVHDFLRAYYHHKSAMKDNAPYPLKSCRRAN